MEQEAPPVLDEVSLERWIDERFRGDRPASRRSISGHRRALVVGLVYVVAYGIGQKADLLRVDVDAAPPGPIGWVARYDVVVYSAAALVGVLGLAMTVRQAMPTPQALQALNHRQRRELWSEIRGRRPTRAGDEPVLDLLALRSAGLWFTCLSAATVLVLLPSLVAGGGAPVATALRVSLVLGVLVATGWGIARAGAARRYLTRRHLARTVPEWTP